MYLQKRMSKRTSERAQQKKSMEEKEKKNPNTENIYRIYEPFDIGMY